VGINDPSGFTATAEQLLGSLELSGGRAAVFPLKEPKGYEEPNQRVIQLAQESDGRLVAFCRIDPDDRPGELSRKAVEAGAKGIKLHPAGEEFDIGDSRLEEVYELANDRTLPVLIHAGPEIDGLGETALELCRRFPQARFILAHDALTDLSWIWERVEEHPNLFFDTSWWGPVHTIALLMLVPPGRVLSASDLPYCSPLSGALTTIRCGIQAGLNEDQLRSILGEQFERLLNSEAPLDAGPPPERISAPLDPLLERLHVTLLTGLESLQRGEDMGNAMSVARHACKVSDDHEHAHVFASVRTLLDTYERYAEGMASANGNPYSPGWDIIAAAALVARTPGAPVPEGVA
jgi:predicted TIM-barrel fold metal-dependent hydrolase